ncbi:hypothetical protein RM863_12680 [Streptomyces sp. DSM 41014]|uniref:Helix-turn-helix domain-containing protein n=1 Tax=Streptomyces hintoniae TaxID=3075521 RepID=A0ABU2UIE2_9ACTN|nr:hypothetical protein [Streptomyces sp. DSM 41014]MDT0472979.1 hypothetical protein [Streptomyces sp. DSM 41014]
MSTDEQAPASGSVPVAVGNALTWRWPREMSPYLRRTGLVLLLCQLRNFATASGEVAFNADRKPIRITDIATAACCREKDARRYLEAAIRAGVVRVIGERKRGKATRYAIVPHPFPDWQAAEDYLKSTARDTSKRPPKWSEEPGDTDQSSGHSGPNQFGPLRPEVTDGTADEVRATPARMGSGHSGPNGSGHSGPNNPGGFPRGSQDRAEAVPQPQVDGPPGQQIDPQEHHHPERPDAGPAPAATAGRCRECQIPLIRPGRQLCAGCEDYLATTGRHTA